MSKLIDLATWKRREHFLYFRDFELPFFNICSEVDVSAVEQLCRDGGTSFFLTILHRSLKAANQIEEFRMRLRGKRDVVLHDLIHGSSTVLLPDETFRFANFRYLADFEEFSRDARDVIDSARSGEIPFQESSGGDALIHFSVIPWISFSSLSHARRLHTDDSVPKIVFGRHFPRDGRRWMPISVAVHHALVDGLPVGRFLETFQTLLEQPSSPESE